LAAKRAYYRNFRQLAPLPLRVMLSGMDTHKTALERAFEIARSGGCISVADLIRRLKDEGYERHQIEGPHLKKQLTRLINEAKSAP
jgi:hypothetical protein